MSVLFEYAIAQYKEIRQEFEVYREGQHALAEHDCNARLLSKEAMALGIDSYSLFIGPRARAERWASEELRDWWAVHGRLTYAEFERQHVDRLYEEVAA